MSSPTEPRLIHIVGGGLAGCEAAWQCLRQGHRVYLYEMRPDVSTDAHKTGDLAELVCSNSFKSLDVSSASGRLKEEMKTLDSLVIACGLKAQVPAGQALAIDRKVFSQEIERSLASFGHMFQRIDQVVTDIPKTDDDQWIVATGPLTEDRLARNLVELAGGTERLYFFDAIAPIIDADTIDFDHCFIADRYDKGEADYVNIPLNKEEYENFIDAVIAAEKVPLHQFEDTKYFEACLPIEVMIERGRDTLRFGPLKPVGFTDPRTGHRPWAVIQLRQETKSKSMYSMVGFQTKMKWPAQKEVFQQLKALANAEFLRFGSIHRNTYLESPKVLASDLSFKNYKHIFLAGQVSGVEGYTESAAIGLLAGRSAAAKQRGEEFPMPPAGTIIGALHRYVTEGPLGDFQPMNANLGLLPSIKRERGESKRDKKARQTALAAKVFEEYSQRL